ncbi:MAG TPA: hypothetical protein VFG25_05820 [Nitrosopumilaceae archaeon]|nr:hypothetical protein [Nitrosopumilaceae archaeon]
MKQYLIILLIFLIPVGNSFAQIPDVNAPGPIVAGKPTSNIVEGTEYEVSSTITGGQVVLVSPDPESASLIFDIVTTNNGQITITLPRAVIDAKIGNEDDIFFVLVDGQEVNYSETKTPTHRYLTIPFGQGSEQIEIIGTFVVPEFPFAIIVLSASILCVIFVPQLVRRLNIQI